MRVGGSGFSVGAFMLDAASGYGPRQAELWGTRSPAPFDRSLDLNGMFSLPIVRTSIDHETAFDIAGRGRVDERGLVAASEEAFDASVQRLARGAKLKTLERACTQWTDEER